MDTTPHSSPIVVPNLHAIALRIQNGDCSASCEFSQALRPGLLLVTARYLASAGDIESITEAVLSEVNADLRAHRVPADVEVAHYTHRVMKTKIAQARALGAPTKATQSTSIRRREINQPSWLEQAIGELPDLHREALIRFYLHCERPEQISRELGLTASDFRAIKSAFVMSTQMPGFSAQPNEIATRATA